MRFSNSLKNKTPTDTSWKVHLICAKVQAYSSLEPPLEYNYDQRPWWIKVCCGLLTILGVTDMLCSFFVLVLEGKRGKELPESSRLRFWEKFLANNFALSDAENNILDHGTEEV